MLNRFLDYYSREENIRKSKIPNYPTDVLKIDTEFKAIWEANCIELCKSKFLLLKDEFLVRYNNTPQQPKMIEMEAQKITIHDSHRRYYDFCIDFLYFPINSTLLDLASDCYLNMKNKYPESAESYKTFDSILSSVNMILEYGAYAYYVGFLNQLGTNYNIQLEEAKGVLAGTFTFVIKNTIPLKIKENIDETLLNKNKKDNNNGQILIKPIKEIISLQPLLNTNDEQSFIEVINSIYDIVKKADNIKRNDKEMIRYTTHLLIKNGWLIDSYKSKKDYITIILEYFGYNANSKDFYAFEFPTKHNYNLVNPVKNKKYHKVFSILHNRINEEKIQ